MEVVKESKNEETYFDMNNGTKSIDELVNEENDSDDAFESMGEIDNRWYTFVKNTKTFVPETVASVQEKEFCLETELTSSNESEKGKHVTEENEHDEDKSMKDIDNESYTFMANDKISDFERDVTVEREKTVVLKAKKRPYQCSFCQKAFQTSSSLKSHERIHTGEVPFGCKTCSNRFKTKGDLKKHERIHTGEVPYQCKTCEKRFNQPSNLKRHERFHTGEVPYECETCKKRFKQTPALKYHEKQNNIEMHQLLP